MKKFFMNKTKYNKIVGILSIIVAVFTINVFTFPASTLDSICEGDTCLSNNIDKLQTTANTSDINTYALNNGVKKPAIDNSSKLSTITTVDTRDLIEINLYDYGDNINENYHEDSKYPGFSQGGGAKVDDSKNIDKSNAFSYGGIITADMEDIVGVNGTGINGRDPKYPLDRPISGAMLNTLKDGYPALSDVTSLAYLFTQNEYASKQNEESVTKLFQYDSVTGSYYYNSRDNHAQFNDETDEFVVYNQKISPDFMVYPFGNFLPFNDIVHETTQSSLYNGERIRTIIASAKYESTNSANNDTYKTQYEKLATVLTNFDSQMTEKKGSNYTASQAATQYFTAAKLNVTIGNDILQDIYTIDYDEKTDFFFGFEMKMNFIQPKNGKTGENGNENMRFYFAGDDDVWVYIDGILFLDLSGIHRHVGGEIDFESGMVYYYELDTKTTGDIPDLSDPEKAHKEAFKEESFADILKRAHKEAIETLAFSDEKILESINNLNSKGTFKDYTTHTFNFYYMERGSGSSVMRTKFNMPLIKDNSITINKELSSNDASALGNPEFYFQVMKPNSTADITDDELFVGANYSYDVYDDHGTKLRSETTDSNGIITLKAGEHAVISGIAENSGTYYVRELLDEEWVKQYKQVVVDGKSETLDSYDSSITVGTDTFTGIVSTTKDISDGNTTFTFSNTVDVNQYGKLKIKKSLASGSSETLLNKSFKFYVTIDDVPLKVGTTYKIGDTSYTVEELGIIKLKPNEEAVIDKILANSEFKVEERLSSTSGLIDSYKIDDIDTNTEYATGTINVSSTVSVDVINTEKDGINIEIPVKKTTTNPDGVEYTYTFTLVDKDLNKTISTKSITVDETGEKMSNALFKVEYSQAEHAEGITTHNYKIYEEKKTTLGDVVVNDDKYTLYDESVYDLEVKVNNTSSGFTATYTIKKDGEKVDNIVFNNKKLSSLTLKKIVEGTGVSDSKKFNFNIESTDIVDGSYETSSGTIEFKDGKATTSLGHNETITIYGLPYGSKYTITETNKDGFVTMYKVDSAGLIEGDKVTDVTLLNKNTEVNDNNPFGINYDTLVTFKNVKGYELPKTGSSGMLAITSIGIISMSISFVYLLKKKRGEI